MSTDNLHIPITGDNQGFINALNGAREGVRKTAQDIEKSGMSIEQFFDRIKNAAALSLAGFSAKEFIQKVASIRGEFQQLEVAFNTMLGSADKANRLMSQLVNTAAKTPFDLKGVAEGAKQLLAYGEAAENINDDLNRLGNIAAGMSLPLSDLIYLYGTTMSQGRLYARDVLQFSGRGIPLVQELQKQFGATREEINKMVSEGKIGFPQVKAAIVSMTSSGGQFYNLMEEQSKTITGQISNLQDSLDMMFNEIGKSSEGIINDAISAVSYLVEHYKEIGAVLNPLIITYGAYKAALIATAAVENLIVAGRSVQYFALLTTRIGAAAAAQRAFNIAALQNPYVLLGTAAAGLIVTMALLSGRTNEYTKQLDEANKKIEEQNKQLAELDKRQDYMAEANKKASESVADQINKIEILQSAIEDETNSLDDRRKAIKELAAIVPNYEASLNDEGNLYIKNANAVSEYIEKLKQLALAKALQSKREELTAQQVDAELNRRQSIRDRKKAEEEARNAARATEEARKKRDEANAQGRRVRNLTAGFDESIISSRGDDLMNSQPVQLAMDAEAAANAKLRVAQNAVAIADKTILSTTRQIGELDALLKEYKKKGLLPEQTAATTTTTATTPKHKKDDPRIKNEQDIAKAILDLQDANEKEKIDLMEESTEKRLALSKYEFERRRDELDRQHKELVNKRGGNLTEAEEKTFTDARLLNEQRYTEEVKDIISDEFDTRQRYMRAYLAQYGTYEEKRQAITQKYEEEINKAKTEGEKMTLKNNMQEDLDELEEKYGKVKSFLVELFEDASKKSIKEIQRIINKYEALVAFLKGEHSQTGRKDLIESFGFTDKEIDKAIEKLDKEGFDSINSFMNRLKSLKEEISDRSPWQKFKKDINDAVDMLRKSKGDSDKIGTAISNIGSACEEYLPQVEKFASGLYSIFGIDDSAAKSAISAIGGLSKATQGIGQLFSGDYIDGLTNTIDGLSQSFNGLADMINDIYSKRDMDDVYNNIELEAIRKSVDKIVEKMDNSTIAEAIDEYEEAMERYNEGLLKAQQNVQDAFSESSSSLAGRYNHHSINYYMNEIGGQDEINQINRLLGTNLTSFGDLWYLSPDQLAEIERELPYIFSIIEKGIETMSENASASSDDENAREALAAYMEWVGKKKEIEDAFNQKMTGTTLENVRSEFRNTLSDMASDAEAFAENFEDMLANAIINSMMSNRYNQELEKWYQAFSNAYSNDNNLSEDEIMSLRENYDNIVNAAVAERNALLESLNISPKASTYEQSASSGAWQSLGEETGQELNGRFAALQMSGEKVVESLNSMLDSFNALLASDREKVTVISEIRNLMIFNNAYLEDILNVNKSYYADFKRELTEIRRSK